MQIKIINQTKMHRQNKKINRNYFKANSYLQMSN